MARPSQAVGASRSAPPSSLDYWPTPPWVTRALFAYVMPHLRPGPLESVWEPAAGDGHMARVLSDHFQRVVVSDVFSYDYVIDHGDCHDFLSNEAPRFPSAVDWVITNPPFNVGDAFVHRGLMWARRGVAMFHRLQWWEGGERYDTLFAKHPPTIMAIFSGRVNIVPGRLDPKGSSPRAYAWTVWLKDAPRLPTIWIPPSSRAELDRASDYPAWPLSAEETPLLCQGGSR